jgi:hypothetical protein
MRDAGAMAPSSADDRPSCPRCGEPIGTYEPVWHVAPHIGAEPTSWLRVRDLLGPRDSLWHAACAEADGVDGG